MRFAPVPLQNHRKRGWGHLLCFLFSHGWHGIFMFSERIKCRELEEHYKVNYTLKILATEPEDRHPVIKEMVYKKDLALQERKEETLGSCPWLQWSMYNITQESCVSHELSAACQPSMSPMWGNWTKWDASSPCYQWTHKQQWIMGHTFFSSLLNLGPSIYSHLLFPRPFFFLIIIA